MVGQTISHYRIIEQLGGGGMGVVYKAIDVRLNRPVALKFLTPALTRDREANERFRHEAQAASALDHPNICTIHEIDETPDGELFFVMAYYDGETLKELIERGPLGLEKSLDIASQIAKALARAHESGLVHRDIKPANLMITREGLVKILDFGLVKLAGGSDVTRTGTTVGTVAYMSPEQIAGEEVDSRADLWALGVVLYEMLGGARPFAGKDDFVVLNSILNSRPVPLAGQHEKIPAGLQRVVARALEKKPASRYGSAGELLADLTACQTALRYATAPAGTDMFRLLRRPLVAVPAAAVLIAAVAGAAAIYRGNARTRWARNEAIPQIMRLVQTDDYTGAFALAKQAERYIPNDPVLSGLWPQFSSAVSIKTEPAGADVYVQPYAATDNAWQRLGPTPIEATNLPLGVYRFRIEKEGFETLVLAARNPGNLLGNLGAANVDPRRKPVTISLMLPGRSPGMVPVPGGAFPLTLSGFNTDDLIALDPFLIDRNEVTNREFKQFVDDGGYGNEEYWHGLSFVADGHQLTWQEALSEFRDSTGRPGPATWELGAYPAGQDQYPVGSVSWYEAVAYCRSKEKVLPTVFHWARTALSPAEHLNPLAATIVRFSNLGKQGPAPVGSFRGMGPYGTYDMAGNVREWAWNEAAGGRRWIAGGAWNDPEHMFIVPNSLPPFDRSATNGFRCAQYGTETPIPDRLMGRVEPASRDCRSAKAVSDEVFDVFRRQFSYVKSALNARVERRDTSGADWIREKITLDAGYESERVTAFVFLPHDAKPPYQVVVEFPGLTAFLGRASSEGLQPGIADFIVKTGRALVLPVWKGSYERWDPFNSLQGEEYLRTFRMRMFQWRQDLGRLLDTLSTRNDIDSDRIGYLGVSFGSSTALPLLALDERLKVAVLMAPGFTYRLLPPEADPVNYVSRVKMPVLMLGGRHDYVFPLETSQAPLFDRLGTAPEQKRHVVFDAGHLDFPRSQTIREVLAWLDRYLGPVASPAATH
jgi:formylglycine-generating enzyme required for sulfatase activity/dienelactone hydrolase